MVPRYTAKVPYLGQAIRRQQAEYHAKKGRAFDFGHAFWTPPLSPRQAYRLEEKQIQRRLQLRPLVSLTDHDDTRAGALLRVMSQFRKLPLATEWTIPFGPTFFHLGVHNLPAERLREIETELASYTKAPNPAVLADRLAMLNDCPDTLLVLNHPLWDEKGVRADIHRQALAQLLERHGSQLHAFELNGLRSWAENKETIALGRATNLPVVSGGDRHGREPNAVLNLSAADSFAEFVHQVRVERKSHVLFMPQYREPLRLRVLQTMMDVVRDFPENIEGRRVWSDRVFYRDPLTGVTTPLTAIWKDGGPRIVRHFIRSMQLAQWQPVQSALRWAFNERTDSEASI
ncbi:MAG TPA: hypothetical protein VHZ55_29115 [Bryobacteraceae bacterium]|nr:hypothetical protein [Bryobacteraceae bacterium]